MIKNFEGYTYELSKTEKAEIYPLIVNMLNARIGEHNAITGEQIREVLISEGYNTTPSRIRKMIHEIRVSSDIKNLIASSQGYYIAESYSELSNYISSLESRGRSILKVANALQVQLREMI